MSEYNTEISQQTNIQSSREAIQSISVNKKQVLERIERLTKKIGGVEPITLRKQQKIDEFTFTQTPQIPVSKRSQEDILEYFPYRQECSANILTPPILSRDRHNPIIQIQEVIPKRIVKNIQPRQQTSPFFSQQFHEKPYSKLNKSQSGYNLARTISPHTRIPALDPVNQVLQSIRSTLIKSKASTQSDYQLNRDIDSLQKKIKKMNSMLTSTTLY